MILKCLKRFKRFIGGGEPSKPGEIKDQNIVLLVNSLRETFPFIFIKVAMDYKPVRGCRT